MLNMSAIAKGYSVDVVARLLERHGVKNYLCEIGGEISAKGVNQSGECWRIGIEKPIDDNAVHTSEVQVVIHVCDKSMATSGDYRNYYIKDGKKYTHTIHPQTGYPSEQNILSATVVASDCMTADAYATAFMVLGMEEAKKMISGIPDTYCYLIYRKEDGTIESVYSEGFDRFLTKQQ